MWWVTHACNPSIGKPLHEGGPTWIAQWGLGKPGLQNETLTQISQKRTEVSPSCTALLPPLFLSLSEPPFLASLYRGWSSRWMRNLSLFFSSWVKTLHTCAWMSRSFWLIVNWIGMWKQVVTNGNWSFSANVCRCLGSDVIGRRLASPGNRHCDCCPSLELPEAQRDHGREGWEFFPLPWLFLWMKQCVLFIERKIVLFSEFSWVPFKGTAWAFVFTRRVPILPHILRFAYQTWTSLGTRLTGLHSELSDHSLNLNAGEDFRFQDPACP